MLPESGGALLLRASLRGARCPSTLIKARATPILRIVMARACIVSIIRSLVATMLRRR